MDRLAWIAHYSCLDPIDARQCDMVWLADFARALNDVIVRENGPG